jgi:hypothetical protein
MEGVHRQAATLGQRRWKPADATPRRAVVGHTHNSGSCAPTNVHAWTEVGGACRPPPHHAEPFLDSPAAVEGAHRQAITRLPTAATPRGAVPGLARGGGRHAPASVCWTPPHRADPFPDLPTTVGGAHQKTPMGAQPRHRQARGETACTAPLLSPCKTRAKKKVGTLPHHQHARG